MPWAEQLPTGRWRAVWRDASGAKRSKSGFIQKRAAVVYANQQEERANIGKPGYTGRSLTWREWWDYWQQIRRVEDSTRSAEAGRVEKWLQPRWGTVRMDRITRDDVQIWVNDLDRHMAPASVDKVYRILSASLRAAKSSGLISDNPCIDIAKPVIPPPDEQYLTRAEFDAAADNLTEPYRTMAILLVGTGLRFGEAAGLHWSRVDLDAEAIDVIETWVPDPGVIKPYPKGRRKRRVPLPTWVTAAILANQGDEEKTCGLRHVSGRCTSGLVVPAVSGGAINAKNMLRRHWGPALTDAGLSHYRQHDLRHTCASWLIQGGLRLEEVAQLLGHSSVLVTAKYAHLAPDYGDKARDVLNG